MMRKIILVLVIPVFSAGVLSAEDGTFEVRSVQFVVDLDRELAGLLDAYLEAVPECPVYPDTPLRLWVLDLGWIRADAALREAETISVQFPDSVRDAWIRYLESGNAYLAVYQDIQVAYHSETMPDSETSCELENDLLRADSLWRIDEAVLFELLAEEEIR